MSRLYLSIGSNLGDREQHILKSIRLIEKKTGKIVRQSSLYETAPWGFNSSHLFLNNVVAVETDLPPFELLKITQQIEKEVGRKSKTHQAYTDRVIDIDIVMYDDLILQTEKLTIPHPLFHLRRFVLLPLSEIAPDLVHPILGKTMEELVKSI